jgi:hypothetical protein
MDFAWVSLKTANKDGSTDTLVWRMAGPTPDMSRVVIMNVPLADSRTDTSYKLEIAISVNGSFESVSHRAMLFSRLIDEHNMVDLVPAMLGQDHRRAAVMNYIRAEDSISASAAAK